MLSDDWAQLIFYGLLLVVIGGSMLVEFSGRGGKAIRQGALWAVIFAGVFFFANQWIDKGEERQRMTGEGRVEIEAGRDGHFHLTADLNGKPVRFIVDTGASSIALSPDDARQIGIDPENLAYIGFAQTANGVVKTANVTIKEFAIENIIDHDVPAVVIGGELDRSLLGMNYLRRFARVSFEGDLLLLER